MDASHLLSHIANLSPVPHLFPASDTSSCLPFTEPAIVLPCFCLMQRQRKRSRGKMWRVEDGLGFVGFKEVNSSLSFPGSLQQSAASSAVGKKGCLHPPVRTRWKKGFVEAL